VEQEFRYPLEKPVKVAVLLDGFRSSSTIRNFSDFDLDELAELETEAIAAPLPLLRTLAELEHPVHYPLVVFTGPRFGYLTSADRDLFWKAFRMPVFEQLTGVLGEVVAEECEAHEGLHIRTTDAIVEIQRGEVLLTSLSRLDSPVFRVATVLRATIETAACSCGRSEPRLLQQESLALAASA